MYPFRTQLFFETEVCWTINTHAPYDCVCIDSLELAGCLQQQNICVVQMAQWYWLVGSTTKDCTYLFWLTEQFITLGFTTVRFYCNYFYHQISNITHSAKPQTCKKCNYCRRAGRSKNISRAQWLPPGNQWKRSWAQAEEMRWTLLPHTIQQDPKLLCPVRLWAEKAHKASDRSLQDHHRGQWWPPNRWQDKNFSYHSITAGILPG